MAVYYASKAFVLSFTEALHDELRGTGVSVTNLCPGPTESNFSQIARSHRARKVRAAKMSAAEVAAVGHRSFRQGRCLSVPGIVNQLLTSVVTRVIPRGAARKLSGHYNKLD